MANLINYVKENIGTIGAGVGGIALGSAVGILASNRSSKRKKRQSSKIKRTRKRNNKSKRRKYKYARTAGKRKDRSKRRIRITKTGQPYIILASGKARFIKRSSARNSRRRKGGRY